MNSIRKSPVVNLLSLLVAGLIAAGSSPGAAANERRDGVTPVVMPEVSGQARGGLRELGLGTFVSDKHVSEAEAKEATPWEAEALAPYLEMHGHVEVGVRPVILPWSVRMESVN